MNPVCALTHQDLSGVAVGQDTFRCQRFWSASSVRPALNGLLRSAARCPGTAANLQRRPTERKMPQPMRHCPHGV